MNTRNRNLLVVALATALAVPLAAANGLAEAGPRASAQTETTQGELDEAEATEALPPQVNPIEESEQGVDPRVPPVEDAEDPMSAVPPPPPPPMQSRDTMPDDPADAAHDARWAELDADGDGRINAQEGAADADFNANFEMMDGDGDGFVTDAEFRAHATEHEGMKHESMEDDGSHDMDRDDHKDGMKDMDDDGTDDAIDTTDDDLDAMDDPVDGGNAS